MCHLQRPCSLKYIIVFCYLRTTNSIFVVVPSCFVRPHFPLTLKADVADISTVNPQIRRAYSPLTSTTCPRITAFLVPFERTNNKGLNLGSQKGLVELGMDLNVSIMHELGD